MSVCHATRPRKALSFIEPRGFIAPAHIAAREWVISPGVGGNRQNQPSDLACLGPGPHGVRSDREGPRRQRPTADEGGRDRKNAMPTLQQAPGARDRDIGKHTQIGGRSPRASPMQQAASRMPCGRFDYAIAEDMEPTATS